MRKRKWMILSLLFILLLLTGCSNKDVVRHYYNYQGENESWKAEYIVNAKVTFTENKGVLSVDSESEEIFILTYQGELSDLSSVRLFEFGYESPVEAGNRSEEYTTEHPIDTKIFKIRSGGKGGALPNEDTVYTVTVNMDGVKQSFELQSE
ncbi:MAG: hypothetical protein K0R46_1426 [Herbinix sp.]|jgi:hypothetical protein|nr:hypothetical protein [Herbinix sp.]